jgi:endonuclease IV
MKDLMKFLRRIGVLPALTTDAALGGIFTAIVKLEDTNVEQDAEYERQVTNAIHAQYLAEMAEAESMKAEKVAAKLRDLVTV